jgi:hypothetical protein
MSIVNRRNAMLGWATWTAAKQVAAHKARSAAQVEEGKPWKRLILTLLAAAGAIAFFWRHKTADDGGSPGPE